MRRSSRSAGPCGRPCSRSGPPRPPRDLGRAEEDIDRAAKLWAVAGYFEASRRGIENYAIVPLASSRPMEKAVDVVVARRFKARGMSWLRHGVSALVRLRTLRLSGTWTASSGPWAGGTMRLAHGYETLSGDGLRHGRPAIPGWGAADAGLVYYLALWPNLLLSVAAD